MENTSMHLAADGVYKFYEDGTATQTGTWWNGSVPGGSFLRSPILSGTDPDFYHDFLTPYSLSGSVMTMDQGDGSPAYVVTKAAELAGTVTTLAGSGAIGHDDSAIGTSATFNVPMGVVMTAAGLVVVDTNNNLIRNVGLSGTNPVTLLAGSYPGGGLIADSPTGTLATFSTPVQAVSDGTYLYISDSTNSRVRRMSLTSPYAVDRYESAAINNPSGILINGGNLHVMDYQDGKIYSIAKGNINASAVLVAPDPGSWAVNSLNAIAMDDKFIYAADTQNHVIRRLDIATEEMTIIAGNGTEGHSDGYGTSAALSFPWGLAVDSNYLYISEIEKHTIRRMHLGTRYVDTLAGTYGSAGAVDGVKAVATLNTPAGLCLSGGTLYVADSGNNKIRAIR